MYQMVDYISGNMGYVGLEPGVLYHIGSPYETVEVTGHGSVTLENCQGITELEILGRSEQDSTTGKNLMPPNLLEQGTISGGKNNDNTEFANIRVRTSDIVEISAGEYTVSGKGFDEYNYVFYYSDDTWAGDGTWYKSGTSFNMPQNRKAKFVFRISNGEEIKPEYIKDLQIEKGTVATAYEPYTGGKATPSPDSTQEIRSVGARTKNLCKTDFADWESGQYAVQGGGKVQDDKRLRVIDLINTGGKSLYFDTGNSNYKFVVRTYSGNDISSFARSAGSVQNKTVLSFTDQEKYISVAIYAGDEVAQKYEKYRQLFSSGEIKPLIYLASEVYQSYEPYGYKLPIKADSANLFNAQTQNQSGLTCENINGQYVISGATTSNVWAGIFAQYYIQKDGDYTLTLDSDNYGEKGYMVQHKLTEDGKTVGTVATSKLKLNLSGMKAGGSIKIFAGASKDEQILRHLKVMLNAGTTALPWEPYQTPQTITLYSREPWRGNGQYADTICRIGDVWGIQRAIHSEIISGNEVLSSSNTTNRVTIVFNCPYCYNGSLYPALSNRFSTYPAAYRVNVGYNTITISTPNEDSSGAEGLLAIIREWYNAGCPLEVTYPMCNGGDSLYPIWEPFDAATSNALDNLLKSKGTITISTDDPMLPEIRVTCKKGR